MEKFIDHIVIFLAAVLCLGFSGVAAFGTIRDTRPDRDIRSRGVGVIGETIGASTLGKEPARVSYRLRVRYNVNGKSYEAQDDVAKEVFENYADRMFYSKKPIQVRYLPASPQIMEIVDSGLPPEPRRSSATSWVVVAVSGAVGLLAACSFFRRMASEARHAKDQERKNFEGQAPEDQDPFP